GAAAAPGAEGEEGGAEEDGAVESGAHGERVAARLALAIEAALLGEDLLDAAVEVGDGLVGPGAWDLRGAGGELGVAEGVERSVAGGAGGEDGEEEQGHAASLRRPRRQANAAPRTSRTRAMACEVASPAAARPRSTTSP